MSRARNIKPGFYKNEDLAECSVWARLLFPGLWMLADREGRLEDRPKRIKGEIFPFDSVEVEPLLAELEHWKFIARYEKGSARYIQILNFTKHQRPHVREKASEIPPPDGYEAPPLCDTDTAEDKSKHNLGDAKAQPRQCQARSDSLNPDSLNPESVNPSEAIASGGKPPRVTDPDEIIFGYGVPLLTSAGTPEKQARSFLGGLRKHHGDDAVIEKLRDCIKAKPLQPIEWLGAALPPRVRGSPGRRPAPENFAARDYGTGGAI